MYDPIKNDYQAYVNALTLSIIAKTNEQSKKCVSTAEEFALQLSPEEREKGKSEAKETARQMIADLVADIPK